MARFDDRVSLVTGGALGIGAATARRLAAGGARVVIVDLNGDAAEAVAREAGGVAIAADVSKREQVETFVADRLARHGRLDILVNNAGVGCLARTPDPFEWERVIAIDHAREGIRVNALCPGPIETPLTAGAKALPGLEAAWHDAIPMGRPGAATEMAEVVAFLASDAASDMTGSIVVADGGQSAWTGQPDVARFLPQ